MRITFIGPVPPILGGIAHHSSQLVDALRKKGNDVEVISWRAQYPRLLYRGVQRDPNAAAFSGTRFLLRWWSPVSWWRARRIARRSDLLVFPYVTPFLAIPQWLMATGSHRVAAIVHNALPHERMPFERPLARLCLRKADLLITHGEGVADDLRALGVAADIDVILMPPTLQVRPSHLPTRPPLRLLFFGYVRPYKGLRVAISSVALLLDAGIDTTLTVMGDFWEPVDEYTALVNSLGLKESVQIRVGYADDDDLRKALADHHVVVAPYLEDSLSGVVPVAFAAGRPVVATWVRGVAEQVDDGVNGVLVSPGDPQALARGLILSADNLDRLAAGAAASAPTWEDVSIAISKQFN